MENLEMLKKQINNDDKFNIVMQLAKQRNPWLESIIHEIGSALKGAEDYFSHF